MCLCCHLFSIHNVSSLLIFMQSFTFELPMKKYLVERFMKNNFKNRTHIIFDQLNPEYAKFYKKEEICELIEKNGFTVEQTYDSAGNNWAVRAIKKYSNLMNYHMLNEPAPQNLYSRNIRCLLIFKLFKKQAQFFSLSFVRIVCIKSYYRAFNERIFDKF